jgi:flagellar hook-associated protein 2
MSSSVTPTNSLGAFLANTALTTFGSTTTNSSGGLQLTGLASGLNWSTVISELAQAERGPETQWQQQQTNLNAQSSDYTTISAELTTLSDDITALQNSSLYSSSSVQSSNTAIATAATAAGSTLGTYSFTIGQLATAASFNGSTRVSQVISPTNNPSSVTIGTAGFTTPVTAGTFTVNGAQVTVSLTDSLQQVFDAISTATGGTVTASYDSTADKISLTSSSGNVVLGSGADTSNFLQVAQLYNNGSSSVTSNSALGRVQMGVTMTNADLATAITDGGSGAGQFTINGVAINYDASTDSIHNVLSKINSSTAGVTASYDSVNDRFVLTNTTTGDVGISMKDVTGNFLAATGISSGTLQRGQNLTYTLNGGTQQLVSQSNTIEPASSGIAGLTVTALATGTTTITSSASNTSLSSAIQQFVKDYNAVQTEITSQQAVTQGTSGTTATTIPGTLTGDQTASELAGNLRSLITAQVPGLSGTISLLSDLGIQTNSKDNSLSVDTTTLNSALTGNLSNVQALFNDPTNGLGTKLLSYIKDTTGTNGTLTNHQASLAQQSANITSQISNLETKITADSAQWTSEFQAMELADSQASQELSYLSQQVTSGSL